MLKRTDSQNPDFQKLVRALDIDLAIRDGDDHDFYAQFNKIDSIKNVIVYYENEQPIGCGAFKKYNEKTVEIKRMYVVPTRRNLGLGAKILRELEQWASELNYNACILETGKMNPEAIQLYEKMGYETIPNFGQYTNIENSVCMEISLKND